MNSKKYHGSSSYITTVPLVSRDMMRNHEKILGSSKSGRTFDWPELWHRLYRQVQNKSEKTNYISFVFLNFLVNKIKKDKKTNSNNCKNIDIKFFKKTTHDKDTFNPTYFFFFLQTGLHFLPTKNLHPKGYHFLVLASIIYTSRTRILRQ